MTFLYYRNVTGGPVVPALPPNPRGLESFNHARPWPPGRSRREARLGGSAVELSVARRRETRAVVHGSASRAETAIGVSQTVNGRRGVEEDTAVANSRTFEQARHSKMGKSLSIPDLFEQSPRAKKVSAGPVSTRGSPQGLRIHMVSAGSQLRSTVNEHSARNGTFLIPPLPSF